MPKLLEGMRVLILEDSYLVALEMERMVRDHGGTVLGPVARLEQALELAAAEPLDAAILDVNLDGGDSLALAETLVARGVPVIFATGYEADALPESFTSAPRMLKPVSREEFERMLRKVFSEA